MGTPGENIDEIWRGERHTTQILSDADVCYKHTSAPPGHYILPFSRSTGVGQIVNERNRPFASRYRSTNIDPNVYALLSRHVSKERTGDWKREGRGGWPPITRGGGRREQALRD